MTLSIGFYILDLYVIPDSINQSSSFIEFLLSFLGCNISKDISENQKEIFLEKYEDEDINSCRSNSDNRCHSDDNISHSGSV